MKWLFLLIASLMILFSFPVSAQEPDSANCDVCGYCPGVVVSPPYRNPPSDWDKCRKCLYPQASSDPTVGDTTRVVASPVVGLNLPDPDSHYTVIGCISTKPGKFVSQLSSRFLSIVGGIAFLTLLYGAATIAMSRSDYEKLNNGKRIVYGAIAGLVFVLFTTFIIRVIAVNILKIPGFGQ